MGVNVWGHLMEEKKAMVNEVWFKTGRAKVNFELIRMDSVVSPDKGRLISASNLF